MEQISQSAALYKKQIELEETAIDNAVRHYSRQMGQSEAHLPAEFAFLGKVFPLFESAISQYQKERGKPSLAKSVLKDIPAKDAAFLALNSIIYSSMGDRHQVPIQKIAAAIGADIYDHAEYLRFVAKCKENGSKAHKWIQENSKTASEWRRRAAIKKAAKKEGLDLPEVLRKEQLRTVPEDKLSNLDEFKVGEKLVDILMTSTDMFRFAGGTSKAGNSCLYLQPSPETEEWLNDIHILSAISRPKYLPCVIPPRNWKDLVGGGYYLKRGKSELPLLRTRHKKAFQANTKTDLTEVFSALNTVQETGWRVNRKVLEVLQEGSYLPEINSYIPDALSESEWEAEFKKATIPASYQRNLRRRREAFQRITSDKSKVYAIKKTVEIAAQMAEYPVIYFPHNLDYRGRCYPVPSYLNPQGDDVAKGLLEFSKGHPITHRGAYWLAIHGANSWGHKLDKDVFQARFQWVQENTEAILQVAANPHETSWWREAESPCSFLAFCFEWAGYQQEGASFITRLSIDMDGSCNGLQHLSALLRDEKGGALVNLVPVEKPSDVYTNVMEYVSTTVEKDSEAGNKLAKLWAGKVDRKLVKRPVMTQGYGVTPSGIKNQLSKEVSKRTGGEWNAVKTSGFEAYGYLGGVIDGSIAEAMPGVFVVKNWLREVAAKFTEKNLPIQWKTPTGLAVVQENYKQQQVKIKSFYGVAKFRNAQNPSRITLNQDTDKLDKTEQMNALVPNVIHSLDAAHLMKTVNACAAKGITDFHAIHDSFGVHACFVDDLHRITREEFVKLYQEDVLEDLRQQFEAQLGEPLEGVKWRGSLDITQVLSAEYFWA